MSRYIYIFQCVLHSGTFAREVPPMRGVCSTRLIAMYSVFLALSCSPTSPHSVFTLLSFSCALLICSDKLKINRHNRTYYSWFSWCYGKPQPFVIHQRSSQCIVKNYYEKKESKCVCLIAELWDLEYFTLSTRGGNFGWGSSVRGSEWSGCGDNPDACKIFIILHVWMDSNAFLNSMEINIEERLLVPRSAWRWSSSLWSHLEWLYLRFGSITVLITLKISRLYTLVMIHVRMTLR